MKLMILIKYLKKQQDHNLEELENVIKDTIKNKKIEQEELEEGNKENKKAKKRKGLFARRKK